MIGWCIGTKRARMYVVLCMRYICILHWARACVLCPERRRGCSSLHQFIKGSSNDFAMELSVRLLACAAFYIFLATILTFFAGFAVLGYVRPKTDFANIMAVGGGLGMVRVDASLCCTISIACSIVLILKQSAKVLFIHVLW